MKLKKGKFLGAFLLSVLLLASCKTLKNTNTLFQSEYDKFADTSKSVYVANKNTSIKDGSYKIQPFEIIAIRDQQNINGLINTGESIQSAPIFRSDKNGTLTLPVVGEVNVNGLTIHEATAKIQEIYSKSLLKNPIIELSIVNNKVTLLGEVGLAGNFQLEKENMNLIELLGKANGLSVLADPSRIKIIRGNLKNPEIIFINLKNVKSLASDKMILQKDDIIYVAPKALYSLSEGIKNYSGILQPAFIILNTALVIYTIANK